MRRLGHFVRRFVGSLGARRPGPADQSFVAGLLTTTESGMFWSQPVPDLAHALRSARSICDVTPQRIDLVRAALLHDIGKRHSGIGTFRRSIATACSIARVPTTSAMSRYLEHAEIGARDLERLGCEDVVVQFARHHHGSKPGHLAAADWDRLVEADDE